MEFAPFSPLDPKDFSGDFGEFFRLMKEKNKDCPEEDCDKILSPCCEKEVTIVFGSIPLTVECSVCKKAFKLSELLTA